MMNNPLFVFALEEESADLFIDYRTIYTGVGKVQASLALAMAINNDKPDIIINLGTAGSCKHAPGQIVNPISFIQRDMDATALGVELYETPFAQFPKRLDYGINIENIPHAICGTGDNFSTTTSFSHDSYDIVDMEAYALAYVSKSYQIPFLCLKYISDGANDEASQDWPQAMKLAANALRQVLDENVSPQFMPTKK